MHVIAKGGAKPDSYFKSFCLHKIKDLTEKKVVDTNSIILIKIALGINMLTASYNHEGVKLSTNSTISGVNPFNAS